PCGPPSRLPLRRQCAPPPGPGVLPGASLSTGQATTPAPAAAKGTRPLNAAGIGAKVAPTFPVSRAGSSPPRSCWCTSSGGLATALALVLTSPREEGEA